MNPQLARAEIVDEDVPLPDLAAQYDWLATRFVAASPRPFDPWAACAATDPRRGVTVIGRFADETLTPIRQLLRHLRERLDRHFVYPDSSVHLTLVVPVPAGHPFQGDPSAYGPVVRSAIRGAGVFGIRFSGVSVAGSAVILCGFPVGNDLAALRRSLRGAFVRARLPNFEGAADCYDGIRRPRCTAHVTIARLAVPDHELERRLESLRDFSSPEIPVSRIETVRHDEFLTPTKCVVLDAMPLRTPPSCQ